MKIISYEQKSIKEISEKDSKILLLGTIIDVDDTRFVIDDGEGKAEIIIGEYSKIDVKELKVGDIVKVFGRVYSKDGIKIFGDVIQKINGLNIEKFIKLRDHLRFVRGELNV